MERRLTVRSPAERIPVSWTPSTRRAHPSSSTTMCYADFRGCVWLIHYTCTASVVPHIAPSFSHSLCFRALGYPRSVFALEACVVCSGRVVSKNTCIRGKGLFGEGHRELLQLVIRGEWLTGDDSIAYDRSFA